MPLLILLPWRYLSSLCCPLLALDFKLLYNFCDGEYLFYSYSSSSFDTLPKQRWLKTSFPNKIIFCLMCVLFIRHSYNDIIVLIMTFHYGYYYWNYLQNNNKSEQQIRQLENGIFVTGTAMPVVTLNFGILYFFEKNSKNPNLQLCTNYAVLLPLWCGLRLSQIWFNLVYTAVSLIFIWKCYLFMFELSFLRIDINMINEIWFKFGLSNHHQFHFRFEEKENLKCFTYSFFSFR